MSFLQQATEFDKPELRKIGQLCLSFMMLKQKKNFFQITKITFVNQT